MDEGDTVTFASGAAYGALLVGRYGYGAVTGADRGDRAGSACSEEEAARDHPWAPYVAEFVGTFILVFTFGCVALSTVHVPWKPTAWACTVTVMIYSTAPVSGGFLNPAVSMALSLLGVIPGHRCLGFCLTQFIAALCASALLKGLCGVGGSAFRSAMEVDDPPLPGSLLMFLELLYTAVLCFAASCCLVLKRNNPKEKSQSFGLAIGLLYVAGGHALHLERGATMNPAITLAVATVAPGGWHWALPWALAEFLGALLGTYLFAVLRANAEDFCQEEFLELCAPRRSARLLGELIGTFTYVLTFGLNAVSLSEATAWSCAGALISMIYAVGKISGGHFNPAVTLAVVLSGRSVCSVADGLAYAAVQVCGGLAAGLLVAVYHMNGPYFFLSFTPLPAKAWRDYSVVQVGLAEGVFTFVLAYVALACSTVAMPKAHKRQNLFFGLAEGFCVMTGGCAVGTFSGGMLNPAVAVGVWMLNVAEIHSIQEAGNGLCTLLKFSTFQCTGGLLAAVVFRITHPSEYCKAPLLVR